MPRAACYGAAIGAVAACLKTVGPLRTDAAGGNVVATFAANIPEIAIVTLAFALLCAGAAALRNFMVQRAR